MGVTIKKTVGAGAPEIEDGLGLFRFDGIQLVNHKDWATESDNFGKPDNGDRLHFNVTALDGETGAVLWKNDGDPLEIETLTRVAFGEKSNAYALLKGILTKAELALLDDPEGSLDSDALMGRPVQGIVAHGKSGWPYIDSFMPATKAQIALVAKAAAE
jgi:hypothetical protein